MRAPGEQSGTGNANEQLETLRRFGLSPYCTRAYLALLELGATDARAVSRAARIPPAKVYSSLDTLAERGLVRITLEKPKRYEPVPFGEFVERQQAAHLEQARQLQADSARLSRLFKIDRKSATSDRGTFSVLRGRRSVLAKHRDMASELKDSLIMSVSAGSLSRPGTVRAILDVAHSRGVRARVLAPKPARGVEGPAFLKPVADVRLRRAAPHNDGSVTFAVFDGREALITHHIPDDCDAERGHDVAVHITEAAVAGGLYELLDEMWRCAEPASPRAERASRTPA